MMNENSPICARLMPACTDVRTLCPVKKLAMDTATTLPTTTSIVNSSTAGQRRSTTIGSNIMPTDTKKMAAKMSRTGATSRSTVFSSPDSAISDPAMNAPNATEYPNDAANSAAAKHKATETMSVVSGRFMLTTARMRRGTTSRPTTMSIARNDANCTPVTQRSATVRSVPADSVVSTATSTMAMRSSVMSTPRTRSVNRPVTRCSANALAMIVVDEMAMAAPA